MIKIKIKGERIIGMDNDYNKFVMSKDITAKTSIKRCVFDAEIWVLLPQDIQLDRMIRLTTNLLVIDDAWANRTMLSRRNRRNFISPRNKTENMWV